jgi:hypothetical protein
VAFSQQQLAQHFRLRAPVKNPCIHAGMAPFAFPEADDPSDVVVGNLCIFILTMSIEALAKIASRIFDVEFHHCRELREE